jgi:hypothetical protein
VKKKNAAITHLNCSNGEAEVSNLNLLASFRCVPEALASREQLCLYITALLSDSKHQNILLYSWKKTIHSGSQQPFLVPARPTALLLSTALRGSIVRVIPRIASSHYRL